ncbi:single-stranded DNA-binding protein [Chamaesiphon minutus]|uniref:Single-stranded DNA-binding protein n=1 Tax=Chamaesiphon minutus (strain ATCC 27169 / PCC 6605) TaxID=1173020 RepID=K9UK70_CHAP6|nr:single-stranded DNA-binding protein [Chamaesiphon minutus]AFY94599.1 single-stranded DNA-binding protein [Chamaesiphon minutus PCC 6605]
MNSCILMAEIIKNPEIRSTPDNQMEVANMVVQFAPPLGSRPGERSPTIEVVGWGNLATEMKENYKQGDRVTIEGRLQMNTIERDGYKEKRAQLIASHLYHLSTVDMPASAPTATAAASSPPARTTAKATAPRVEDLPAFDAEDGDNIPF